MARPAPHRARSGRRVLSVRGRGFTLIEVLVALSVMALLAILSWRGIDGMARTQELTRARSDDLLALQAGLSQWKVDLERLAPQGPDTPAIDWDGRAIRMTRIAGSGPEASLRVVAWTRRADDGGRWLRWQSPPLRTRGQWQEAWQRAALWAQQGGAEERKSEVAVVPLEAWQVFYFRGDAWTNPLSSEGTPTGRAAERNATPDGVRVVLTLPPGAALSGRVTIDWVRPEQGGGRS